MPAIVLPGPRRRRRRVPRQARPRLIELDYARRLTDFVKALRSQYQPIFEALPRITEVAQRAREDAEDADATRRILAEIEERISAAAWASESVWEQWAREFAVRTSTFQRLQVLRQTRAALGVDVFISDRNLGSLVEGFVGENVTLIKNLRTEIHDKVSGTVWRGVTGGQLHKDLAKDLDAQFAFGERRAKVIARDQVGKFYGQTNKARQRELGVKEYIWRTVNDVRVRGKPGGKFPRAKYSHHKREGVRFKWSDPPPDGHPGEPILCRCYAEPVFDALLGGDE